MLEPHTTLLCLVRTCPYLHSFSPPLVTSSNGLSNIGTTIKISLCFPNLLPSTASSTDTRKWTWCRLYQSFACGGLYTAEHFRVSARSHGGKRTRRAEETNCHPSRATSVDRIESAITSLGTSLACLPYGAFLYETSSTFSPHLTTSRVIPLTSILERD